jgi:hypothetical protein
MPMIRYAPCRRSLRGLHSDVGIDFEPGSKRIPFPEKVGPSDFNCWNKEQQQQQESITREN